MAESLDIKRWSKADKAALGASVVAHLVLFALLSLTLKSSDVPAPPKPMTVDLIAETDLESTSPDPSAEAPAAMLAPDNGPIEDAPAPEEPSVAEPEPTPPEPTPPTPTPTPPVKKVAPTPPPKQITKTAVRRDPPKITPPKSIPKAPPKKVTPPPTKTATKAPPAKKVAAKATPSRPATKAPAAKTKTTSKTGTGSGRGTAARPSGDLAGMVNAVGKSKSNSKSTGAPAAKSAAQIRQSITTSIGNQVRTPWSRCSVSGVDVDALLTTVKFRLNRDGSLGGFTSTTTSGVNDSNRNQQARHQECARKAIQQASPFTGLPPEHYDYWQNYEFRFQKR